MCTVSWRHEEDGYLLFFNRDERRLRGKALPPRPAESSSGMPYLAPIDPDAGGTWLAVNAGGTTLGLLNHYAADRVWRHRRSSATERIDGRSLAEASSGDTEAPHPETVSRGLIIPQLVSATDPDEIRTELGRLVESRSYRPFVLLAVFDRPGIGAHRHVWDGAALRSDEGIAAPLSSSSFETDRVVGGRRARFPDLHGLDPAEAERRMEAFQRGHEPFRGPESVCMHRPDARTVSLSRIEVRRDRVGFRYGDGPACRAVLDEGLSLSRSAAT